MADYTVEINVQDVQTISLPSAQGLPGPQGPIGPAGATELAFVAGEALGGHRIVTTNGAGEAVYADSTDVTHAVRIAGMTTGAAVLGDSVQVLAAGEIEEPTWTWTPGQALYVGSNGLIATAPPVSGFALSIGYAITATKVFVNIGTPIII